MNHEEIIKKMIDATWNKHNPNACNEFYHVNAVVCGPHGNIVGLENIKTFMKDMLVGFPDLEYKALEVFSSGNKVVVRWQGKGTHKGIFLGNAPTNKKMHYEGISIYVIENQKIKEYYVSADLYGLLKELGLISLSAHPHK